MARTSICLMFQEVVYNRSVLPMRLAATQKQGALLFSFLVLPLLAPLYSSALHTTVHSLSSCSKDPLLERPGALDILRAFCSMNGSCFAKSRKDLIQAPPYLACLWDHLFSCFPLILNYNRAASCIFFFCYWNTLSVSCLGRFSIDSGSSSQ